MSIISTFYQSLSLYSVCVTLLISQGPPHLAGRPPQHLPLPLAAGPQVGRRRHRAEEEGEDGQGEGAGHLGQGDGGRTRQEVRVQGHHGEG